MSLSPPLSGSHLGGEEARTDDLAGLPLRASSLSWVTRPSLILYSQGRDRRAQDFAAEVAARISPARVPPPTRQNRRQQTQIKAGGSSTSQTSPP